MSLRCTLVATVIFLGSGCSGGESVRFPSDGIRLAGEFRVPDGEGPFPALVFIHGSGEEDRGSLRDHAKFFNRLGCATLTYDKRGVGESEGPEDAWNYFRFEDLAADAAAGVAYLAGRPEVDPKKVGLFAVSQGGWVAPAAATLNDQVAFLIVGSASVCTVAEDRLFERAARLEKEGFTPQEIAEVRQMQLQDQEMTRTGAGHEAFATTWRENESKRWFRRVYLSDAPPTPENAYREWYRGILDFDPVPLLRARPLPSLWLFGDPKLDRFGPVDLSVNRLRGLESEGLPYTIQVFSGANHSLVVGNERLGKTLERLESVIQPWMIRQGILP